MTKKRTNTRRLTTKPYSYSLLIEHGPRLASVATRLNVSMSSLVRGLVEDFLRKHERGGARGDQEAVT